MEDLAHNDPLPGSPGESSGKAPGKKRSWFTRLLFVLNWAAIVFLLLACLAPLVSPAVFWPLAFFGLLHPVFVLVNILFLCWWLIRWKKRQALFVLAALLLSTPYYNRQLRISFGAPEKAPAHAFTVMSYNVKLFDLYNWTGNAQTRAKLLTQIAAEQPAVLNLQEFYNEDTGAFRNLDTLKRLLQLPYAHYEYTSLRKDQHWGVVTLSRFPIVDQGRIVFNNRNNNICIYTDIVAEGDTLRVYNMHLQSVSFGYADYKFLDKIKSGEEVEDEMESSKNILRRMKRAYTKRARQAESIAKHIAACPYPVIVCGDFNDPPVSYTYRTIGAGLDDAFVESGSGFGKTFDNPFPLPRIDYIFHSPALQSWEFRTLQEKDLSDHYPIVCKIDVRH